MTLFPAVIDPHNPSHMTIRFEIGRGAKPAFTGVIDGWLQADDSLLLELRDKASSASVSAARSQSRKGSDSRDWM